MPLPIQTGLDALGLARRFGVLGKLPLQLDEIVVPVVVLDAESSPTSEPAAAAERQQSIADPVLAWALVNPAGSNVVLDVEEIVASLEIAPGTTRPFAISQTNSFLTATWTQSTSPQWRDGSVPGTPFGQLWFNELLTLVTTPPPLYQVAIGGGSPWTWKDTGLVVPESGTAFPLVGSNRALILWFDAIGAAAIASLSISWRERVVRSG